MAGKKREPGTQIPEEYRDDLYPDALAGENHGPKGDRSMAPRTTGDIKEAHSRLRDLTKSELRNIPVLRPGDRLDQGATYIDLAGDRTEFRATGSMIAEPENWYVRKDSVGFQLWNKLIGVEEPERLQ